jgi:hypothetical protein
MQDDTEFAELPFMNSDLGLEKLEREEQAQSTELRAKAWDVQPASIWVAHQVKSSPIERMLRGSV